MATSRYFAVAWCVIGSLFAAETPALAAERPLVLALGPRGFVFFYDGLIPGGGPGATAAVLALDYLRFDADFSQANVKGDDDTVTTAGARTHPSS